MPVWQPTATLAMLRRRADWLAAIRGYFAGRGVMEVETPMLSRAANTDPALSSFQTRYHGPDGGTLYLHTSPEFAMKRLLAAGSGDIYALGRVFRDGEAGRHHNPEFTLLEWYRVGWDHHALMDEVAALVQVLLPGRGALERLDYRTAFRTHLGVENVHRADVAALKAVAADLDILPLPGLGDDDLDGWRDLLLSFFIIPQLGVDGRITFLHHYPASQAALARLRDDRGDAVAERFELFLDGVELANGFHELTDAAEQARRFQADNRARRRLGLTELPVDRRLLAALAAGMPACSGVALGLDRLLMVATGAASIDEVLAFPVTRA